LMRTGAHGRRVYWPRLAGGTMLFMRA
jgi:hypothetical protein